MHNKCYFSLNKIEERPGSNLPRMRNDTVSTLTFPAFADVTEARLAKPSLLQRLGAIIAEGRRRKAQRVSNERLAHYSPSMLEAAGLKHLSLANDHLLPLN